VAEDGITGMAVLRAADFTLFRARREGRDRIGRANRTRDWARIPCFHVSPIINRGEVHFLDLPQVAEKNTPRLLDAAGECLL